MRSLTLVASLSSVLSSAVGNHGVYAVFALMALDAVFPAGSELVLIYAGALASGAFVGQHVVLFGTVVGPGAGSLVIVAVAGSLGYLLGSLAGWAIGAKGGRSLIERHGRLMHLDERRLARAERWFAKWGVVAAGVGRVVPVVRSFVSIPAGVFHQPLAPYLMLTAVGSTLWAFAFSVLGYVVGGNWESAHRHLRLLDYAAIGGLAVVSGWLAIRRRPLRSGR